MLNDENLEICKVSGITEEQETAICNFIQGAVYCWCKNRPDEWFSMSDLMGGVNFDWSGTPLIVLYEKHKGKDKDEDTAIKSAGKDSGWLLKKVIREDKNRRFYTREGWTRMYKWDKNKAK